MGDCHETTVRGLAQLEPASGILGIECDTIQSALMACSQPACNVLVVLTRLLFIVCLCPSQGTSTQGKRRPSEDLQFPYDKSESWSSSKALS